MKKQISEGISVRIGKPFLFITLFITSLNISSKAQVYYSNFSQADNHFATSAPTGLLCLAPGFTNASQVADADLTNFSSVIGLLSVGLLCSGNDYSIRAGIALPAGMTEVPAGYYAGFRVRLNSVLTLSVLQSNLMLRTYLGGQVQETTSGTGLLGLSLLSVSTDAADISFQTKLPFDEVEIILNTDVISVGLLFNYQFFFAYASTAVILPVKLSSFKAVVAEKQVQLSWASASETNLATYELERSSDGGVRYTTITSIAAKGNAGGGATYSYTDASVWDGNYIYRIKMIDKDGSADYSALATAKLSAAAKWKVYPTLLNSGAAININLPAANNSKLQIQLATLQGQTVRSVVVSGSSFSIATSNLAAGVYILKLYKNGQLADTEKIVIQ